MQGNRFQCIRERLFSTLFPMFKNMARICHDDEVRKCYWSRLVTIAGIGIRPSSPRLRLREN